MGGQARFLFFAVIILSLPISLYLVTFIVYGNKKALTMNCCSRFLII